jgi:acyl carrier protein
MADLESILMGIIKDAVPQDRRAEVRGTSFLTDLGLNSLKLITLAIELEKRANLDLMEASEEMDFREMQTVHDVKNMLIRYQKKA